MACSSKTSEYLLARFYGLLPEFLLEFFPEIFSSSREQIDVLCKQT
jgi:hypothetical protein